MNSSYDFSFKKRAVVLSAAATATAATLLWRWSRKKTTATVPTDASLPVPRHCPPSSPPSIKPPLLKNGSAKKKCSISNLFLSPNPRGFSDILPPSSITSTSASHGIHLTAERRQKYNINGNGNNNNGNIIKSDRTPMATNTSTPHSSISNEISAFQFINVPTIYRTQLSNSTNSTLFAPPSRIPSPTTSSIIAHQTGNFTITRVQVYEGPTVPAVSNGPSVPTSSLLSTIVSTPGNNPSSSDARASSSRFITVQRWVESKYGYSRASSFSLKTLLGSGASGDVWYATDSNGLEVAVKIFKLMCYGNRETEIDAIAEYNVLSEFVGFNFVSQVYGFCHFVSDDAKFAIVMEFVPGWTLMDQIIHHDRHLPEERSANIVAKVAEALSGLHAQGVIHMDVKPRNILVYDGESGDDIKLIDFGMARRTSDTHAEMEIGTKKYRAPEIIRGKMYGKSVDIFSLGVVLHLMLYGRVPFRTEEFVKSDKEVVFLDDDRIISEDAKDLIGKMLNKSPSMRPVASDIRKHRWIKQHVNNNV